MKDEKAEVWNRRNIGEGEPYKKHITEPLILDMIRPLEGKVVLEQGCGNGHFARKLAKENPKKIILLDLYEGNLECARKNLSDYECEIEYIQADMNRLVGLESSSVNVVTSSFVLSEVENLNRAVMEAHRILKDSGVYAIVVTHPAYSLKRYLEEKLTGKPSRKIVPARHYFDRGRSDFVFGVDSHKDFEFKAPHYNRTIQDYAEALRAAGFHLERLLEPEITPALLMEAKRFKEDTDCPHTLVIKARK